MIIWRGIGFVSFLSFLGGIGLSHFFVEILMGYSPNDQPRLLVTLYFLLAGPVNFVATLILQKIGNFSGHDFFFVPIRHWSWLYAALGILFYFLFPLLDRSFPGFF